MIGWGVHVTDPNKEQMKIKGCNIERVHKTWYSALNELSQR